MENPFKEGLEQSPSQRPALLTVLCVLTFINAGFAILTAIIVAFMSDATMASAMDVYSKVLDEATLEAMEASMNVYQRMAPYLLLLQVVSLTGAIVMFHLKRIGFFVYSGAQLLILLLPLFVGGVVSVFSAFLFVLFVGLYGMNYKKMK